MQTLVSVIIPAYNHAQYVQDAISSIINQTYRNLELLIVDDGSNDATYQKINDMKNECEKRFNRVVFKTQSNKGTCETLNTLINETNGEYIYLLASDDRAKSEAVETLLNFLQNNADYALVVGDNEIIDSQGKICFWDETNNIVYQEKNAVFKTFGESLRHGRSDVDFNSTDFGSYASLAVGNYIPNGYLIRKNIFEQIPRFTKDAPLEDYYMMLQISKYAKLKYIDRVLYSYRRHSSNTSLLSEKMVSMTAKTIEYEANLILSCSEQIKKDSVSGANQLYISYSFQLAGVQKQLADITKQLEDIKKSRTYRLGVFMLYIPKLIKRYLRRILRFSTFPR